MMQKINPMELLTNKIFGKLSSHKSRSDTSTFSSILRLPLGLSTTER